MESWFEPLGVAVVLYVATNLDDALLVVALFADATLRPAHVVGGQYLGMLLLCGASLAASLLGLLVPEAWLGWLGTVPVLMGLAGLRDLLRGDAGGNDDGTGSRAALPIRGNGLATVTWITVASGGDNIAVYTPAFSVMTLSEKLLTGAAFTVLIGLWVAGAYALTRHPWFSGPLRRYGRIALPFTFIGIGTWVFFEAGTHKLLS